MNMAAKKSSKVTKKKTIAITIAPVRQIQVRCGDVFRGGMDDLAVVAIDDTRLAWARPPTDDGMPKPEHVAVRNCSTGRLSVMMTRTLQRRHGRRNENDAAASLRYLAAALGLKVKKAKASK